MRAILAISLAVGAFSSLLPLAASAAPAAAARAEAASTEAASAPAAGPAAAPASRRLPITSPVSLAWAGLSWSVKEGFGLPGPGAGNTWDPAFAWVAEDGLHLKVACGPGGWRSAEVWTNAPFGYGTTTFTVSVPLYLDPFTTFGLFMVRAPAARSAPPRRRRRALPSRPPAPRASRAAVGRRLHRGHWRRARKPPGV